MQLTDLVDQGNLHTDKWVFMKEFGVPVEEITLKRVKNPYEEGKKSARDRKNIFNHVKADLRALLVGSNRFSFYLDNYGTANNRSEALYRERVDQDDDGVPIFFDGRAANFIRIRGKLIDICEFPFSARIASKKPEYIEKLIVENEQSRDVSLAANDTQRRQARNKNRYFCPDLPYGGFGINVTVETSDGYFMLTNRGVYTPRFPNMTSTVSGQVNPRDTLERNVIDKVQRDLGLEDLTDINAMGMIGVKTYINEDTTILTPIVLLHARTGLEMREYPQYRRQHKVQFAPDIANFGFIDTDYDRVFSQAEKLVLVPSAQAGIFYALISKLGGSTPYNETGSKIRQALKIEHIGS